MVRGYERIIHVVERNLGGSAGTGNRKIWVRTKKFENFIFLELRIS